MKYYLKGLYHFALMFFREEEAIDAGQPYFIWQKIDKLYIDLAELRKLKRKL